MVWHQHQFSNFCLTCWAGEYQEKVLSETVQVLSPNIRTTPNSSELQGQAQLDTPNQDYMESDASEAKHTVEVCEDVDPLDKFLLPPPPTTCSIDLQVRISSIFVSFESKASPL